MYHVYVLERLLSGRLHETKCASFVDGNDALCYAKNLAFRQSINVLLVYPDGRVSIHAPWA